MSTVESIPVLQPPIFDGVERVRSGFSLAGERTADRPLGNNMSISPVVVREGLTLATGEQPGDDLDRMVAQELEAAKRRHKVFVRQFGIGALNGVAYPKAEAGVKSVEVGFTAMPSLAIEAEDRMQADASIIVEDGYASVFNPADCPVVDIVDPNKGGVVAQVHAGWQGIVAGIVPRAMATLKDRGLNPAHALVNIHPNATDGFELQRKGLENWRAADLGEFVTEKDNTTYISMTDAVKAQLQVEGVREGRIATSRVYSVDGRDLNTLVDARFYSHRNRKVAGVAGRNAAFLARIGE